MNQKTYGIELFRLCVLNIISSNSTDSYNSVHEFDRYWTKGGGSLKRAKPESDGSPINWQEAFAKGQVTLHANPYT